MAEKRVGVVKLKNVRLSYAFLFQKKKDKPDTQNPGKIIQGKYACSFLFPKNTPEGKELLAAVKAAADEVKKDKWGSNPPKLKADKVCLKDGDAEGEPTEYAGHFYVAGSNPDQPQLIDRKKGKDGKWVRLVGADGRPVQGATSLLYSGCYANAVVRLWAQDNEFGKRINCSIEVVQFLKHGEAFGAAPIDADDALDDADIGDEDDADIDGREDEEEEENSLI